MFNKYVPTTSNIAFNFYLRKTIFKDYYTQYKHFNS